MLTPSERHASRDLTEHFQRETAEYERQRAEVALGLTKDRANPRLANRALRLSDEYDRLRNAIREQDGSYRFPLVSDDALGAAQSPHDRKSASAGDRPSPIDPADLPF